ncbi:hypothetical protein SAMN04489716_1790 [Actinoplanes derwentensis]|uniref:Zinc-binding dehydrogenase n=2 Tax=Actinoplanes derwentensis TaxID=113562 RepID=A0A1H1VJV3_9ACTN|nr:hypothetical protein Ade03nite_25980 [Actinoplanes derwentensis]SDS85158.1 hypothetical protein SAMN04489716_1790 [Actinoplanes derwentensis]
MRVRVGCGPRRITSPASNARATTAGSIIGVSAEAATAGRLTTPIARRYSLDDGVEAAIDYARRHPLGKIVVTV